MAEQNILEVAELKIWLGIGSDDYNMNLDMTIESVSLMMESYCRTNLMKRSTATTEYRDGDGTDTIFTYHVPIVSITSIHDDTGRTYGSNTLIDSGDYVFYDRKIVLTNGTFQHGGGASSKNIQLIYFNGRAVAPEDLKTACKILCKCYWDLSHDGRDIASIKSMSDESGSVVFDLKGLYNWPKEVIGLLNKYRQKAVW